MDLDLTALGPLLFVALPLGLLLVRTFVIPDGASLEDLIAPRMDMEWPHGVQEEEPVPWRTELFTPRDRPASEPARHPVVWDVRRAPGP